MLVWILRLWQSVEHLLLALQILVLMSMSILKALLSFFADRLHRLWGVLHVRNLTPRKKKELMLPNGRRFLWQHFARTMTFRINSNINLSSSAFKDHTLFAGLVTKTFAEKVTWHWVSSELYAMRSSAGRTIVPGMIDSAVHLFLNLLWSVRTRVIICCPLQICPVYVITYVTCKPTTGITKIHDNLANIVACVPKVTPSHFRCDTRTCIIQF